jgi:hypothetical protein
MARRMKATKAARPTRRRNGKATKSDGKSVREMTAEFNSLVIQAQKAGAKAWWIREHVSPFESRAAAVRMIDKLEAAMAEALASRGVRQG